MFINDKTKTTITIAIIKSMPTISKSSTTTTIVGLEMLNSFLKQKGKISYGVNNNNSPLTLAVSDNKNNNTKIVVIVVFKY